MRSLAAKILFSFWLIHAVILVVLTVLPDRDRGGFFENEVDRIGHLAAALVQSGNPVGCETLLAAYEREMGARVALFDERRQVVCAAPGSVTPEVEQRVRQGSSVVESKPGGPELLVQPFAMPGGASYVIAGTRQLGARTPPPDRRGPTRPLVLALAVSAIVCWLLASYLAKPLQQIREATRKLAGGDLSARAGASAGGRMDEIGNLARDFDAMADRISDLIHAQKQLLSDISHELRSPLARLNIALELTRRKMHGDQASADLDRIQVEADRMNEMIGQLLALARTEQGDTAVQRELVDVVALVQSVVEDADYEAGLKHKSVSLQTEGTVEINGAPGLLASAVENVVRNAIRHTGTSTAVEVAVRCLPTGVIISVRDHGPGVPEEELGKIFAPFHRVGSARTRDSGGTGLGLAIAQRAVALHRGTIVARNADGGGLEVRIELPGA